MTKKKFIYTFLLLALSWMGSVVEVSAESRNIYVGDIITLEISTSEYSSVDLRELFQDFEILDIKSEYDEYVLSMRTFEVGEHKVLLGYNEIVIYVSSTLNDFQRDGIFEGETRTYEPGFFVQWSILFFVSVGIFAVSGCFLLLKLIGERKKAVPSSHMLFIQRSAALSPDDDNYFVDLTFYFKNYLESRFLCRIKIIGKTSAEIAAELKDLSIPDAILPEICEWLTECDRLKFTGVEVSSEMRQEHYDRLLGLIEKLDVQNEEAA